MLSAQTRSRRRYRAINREAVGVQRPGRRDNDEHELTEARTTWYNEEVHLTVKTSIIYLKP